MEVQVDNVLVVALASAAGALAFASPWASGLAVGVVLVAWGVGGRLLRANRRGRCLVALVAAFAFSVSAWRVVRAIAADSAARSRLEVDGVWPARCAFTARVIRSPAQAGEGMRVDVDVGSSSCLPFVGRVGLHISDDVVLARGDLVEGVAQLSQPYRFWNDGDPRPLLARRGVLLTGGAHEIHVVEAAHGLFAWTDHARDRIRRRIVATYPADAAAMARALVLGEDDLADGDQRAFRKSGLSHLLAVSGMHLVLVVASIVGIVRAVLVRIPAVAVRVDSMRIAAAIGAPLAWIYADLAGGSGSAIRAAWMASIALFVRAVARQPDLSRALALSIAGMLLVDPLAPYDLSFALSAAATGGLLSLARPLDHWLLPRVPTAIAVVTKPLSATLAATIACTPILATMSGEVPLAGLVANIVAVPVGEAAALPLCLAHTLLPAWPLAERGTAVAAAGALDLVRLIARFFAAVPSFAVPSPNGPELAVLGVLAAAGLMPRPRLVRFGAAVLLVGLEVSARHRPHDLRVTFLDVGQGDAALVDLPNGHAMLIDGGGLVGSPVDIGERVLGPLLRARRRSDLDVVVLSHPHPDHFGGLVRGLSGIGVGAFWDTGQGEDEVMRGGYAELLAGLRARGTPVLRPGDLCKVHEIGGVTVEVLAPCPRTNGDRGPNDNSLVIRIRYGERSFLFSGDAERLEEADLVARGSLHADVLKVGHHGSRTSSSPAFLDAVSPSVAVVSCGVRNRFGHPHPLTKAALVAHVPRVFRTDRDGAVTVTTDGMRLDVETSTTSGIFPLGQ